MAVSDRPPQAPVQSSMARAISGVLRHPVAMALKMAVKNAWWTVKGRGVGNPPLPPAVGSILFVCLGNICRSPFAALLAARRVEAAGLGDVRCASAGISTRQGGRVPSHGREVADVRYGISLDGHRPQTMSRELADAFDLIVVMEAGQLELLRARYPHRANRIVLLPLFDADSVAAHQRYHLDDPFGRPRAAFEACYARIDRALARLLDAVDAAASPRGHGNDLGPGAGGTTHGSAGPGSRGRGSETA